MNIHILWVGEKVYDRNTKRKGIIKKIDDNEGGLEHDMMVVTICDEYGFKWDSYSFYLEEITD